MAAGPASSRDLQLGQVDKVPRCAKNLYIHSKKLELQRNCGSVQRLGFNPEGFRATDNALLAGATSQAFPTVGGAAVLQGIGCIHPFHNQVAEIEDESRIQEVLTGGMDR